MGVSKRHITYTNQYIKENYDRVSLLLPGGRAATVRARAEELGVTVNAYIGELIRRDIGLTEEVWKERPAKP